MTATREIIPFTTEDAWLAARAKDLTSTDVAALFGVSPYLTRFELWHRKRADAAVADVSNERTECGQMLQDGISQIFSKRQQVVLRRMDEYVRMPDLRIGSSFDFCENEWARSDAEPFPQFLVETKNVDGLEFRNGWLETDFGLEAPTHIELQVQHQLLVSGLARAFIAALVGGNRMVVLERAADSAVSDRILAECAAFWAESEPAPVFPTDAAFVAKLYGYSAPGKVAEADDEVASLFRQYAGYRAAAKLADEAADTCKAEILMRIGDAERVTHSEFTLSAKMVKAADVSYHREPYRGFRLFPRGEKK